MAPSGRRRSVVAGASPSHRSGSHALSCTGDNRLTPLLTATSTGISNHGFSVHTTRIVTRGLRDSPMSSARVCRRRSHVDGVVARGTGTLRDGGKPAGPCPKAAVMAHNHC